MSQEYENQQAIINDQRLQIEALQSSLDNAQGVTGKIPDIIGPPRVMGYRAEDYSEFPITITLPQSGQILHWIQTADWHLLGKHEATFEWGMFRDHLGRMIEENSGLVRINGWGDFSQKYRTTTRKLHKELTNEERADLEDEAKDEAEKIFKQIEFTKNLWVLWSEGNHRGQGQFMTTTQFLCHALGGNYIGSGGAFPTTVRIEGTNLETSFLLKGAHHLGGGGGQTTTPGTGLNSVHRPRAHTHALIMIGAHIHGHCAIPAPTQIIDNGKLKTILGWDILPGSFQYIRKDKETPYLKENRAQASLGAIDLQLSARETGDGFGLWTEAHEIFCNEHMLKFVEAR